MAARVSDVGKAIIDTELEGVAGGALRWAIRQAWKFRLASNVTDKAMEKITGELAKLDEGANQ